MDCGEKAFYDLIKQVETEGLTDKIKIFLSVLLPKTLIDRSISLMINSSAICSYEAQNSKRTMWTITAQDSKYYAFDDPGFKYCSCPSYSRDVIKDGRYPFCKHLLAIIIMKSMRKQGTTTDFPHKILPDEEFAMFFMKTTLEGNLGRNQPNNK